MSDIPKALRVPRYGGMRMERKKRTLLKLSSVEDGCTRLMLCENRQGLKSRVLTNT